MALSILFATHTTNLQEELKNTSGEQTKMSAGEAAFAATVVFGGQHNVTASVFQMPLHFPRYKKPDYEKMPEWQIDGLLREYGLPVAGDVHQKRSFAMGAFLWPDQLN